MILLENRELSSLFDLVRCDVRQTRYKREFIYLKGDFVNGNAKFGVMVETLNPAVHFQMLIGPQKFCYEAT